MNLKAAILAALDERAIAELSEQFLARVPSTAAECRVRLQASRRLTLQLTLARLNKPALLTICTVLGLSTAGRRAELEQRLLRFASPPRQRRAGRRASSS
ncbi:MAG: hypothetical protein U0935_17340 [Pirellulales bacterium]